MLSDSQLIRVVEAVLAVQELQQFFRYIAIVDDTPQAANDNVIKAKAAELLAKAYSETKNYRRAEEVLTPLMEDPACFPEVFPRLVEVKVQSGQIEEAEKLARAGESLHWIPPLQ